jgi:N-dimethylarginine dimethylaminohydrolase
MIYNAQKAPYQLRDIAMSRIASLVREEYKRLSKFPGPKQNLFGYREIDWRAEALTAFILDLLKNHPKVMIWQKLDLSKIKVSVNSEEGFLRSCVMSFPTYLDWLGGINETERKFANNKPDNLLAVYQLFLQLARVVDHGTVVHVIAPNARARQMVFTRDSMVLVDELPIIANMAHEERKVEREFITGGVLPPKEVICEGGNFVIGKDRLYIGVNERTNNEAVEWMKYLMGTTREVIPIYLAKDNPNVLHLDCIFCPVEERNGKGGAAIIYKHGFETPRELEKISKMYKDLYEVPHADYGLLGPNVLKLDSQSAIVNPRAKTIITMLKMLGAELTLLAFNEITKSGGAFRCTFAALFRDPILKEAT